MSINDIWTSAYRLVSRVDSPRLVDDHLDVGTPADAREVGVPRLRSRSTKIGLILDALHPPVAEQKRALKISPRADATSTSAPPRRQVVREVGEVELEADEAAERLALRQAQRPGAAVDVHLRRAIG